ncbi:helix-turn-helix transcriptional regulator [Williamsia phyllosphaerae]|uniref:WYL domain-containing protein n=1 Tax=Williamsia phyllosphaerae TaxID=885042 RepID=A0ABQ1V7D1_9NOCA|nr:WYL domain-containing protein [Williamsia phyllosphaerae]GGF42541.1 hypothetical protein GCM10007298_42810 [Williamsia phyllosphaerae]
MATSKVERLMNLVICLLSTRQFLSAEQIRKSVAGYSDSPSDDAFNRMFERDKGELRDLGIPLETGRASGMVPVDGYRINRDAYELPDIDLDQAEAAAVTMAAALWDTPELAATAHTALLKLRAGGVDLASDSELDVGVHTATPRSMGSESVLGSVLAAVDHGRAVTFGYRPTPIRPFTPRSLEPWGVVTFRGRWYVVGHDRDRDDVRTFRLSRIGGDVREFDVDTPAQRPADLDLQQIVANAVGYVDSPDSAQSAKVWIAEGRAEGLRRSARTLTDHERDGRRGSIAEFSQWSVDGLARRVLGAGADAVVLEPDELRDRVIGELRALAVPR